MLLKNFIDSINNISTLLYSNKQYFDSPLMDEEIIKSIDALKQNKSPGPDGLTEEFYKSFPFLWLEVYNKSLRTGTLPPSLMQGLITLITKPKKKTLLIDYWRPIKSFEQ